MCYNYDSKTEDLYSQADMCRTDPERRIFLENKNKNDYKLGILFIIISAFCFALMNLFIRLAGDVPTMQKCFFRNFFALIVAVVSLIRT